MTTTNCDNCGKSITDANEVNRVTDRDASSHILRGYRKGAHDAQAVPIVLTITIQNPGSMTGPLDLCRFCLLDLARETCQNPEEPIPHWPSQTS